jgi:hypothetical protein
MTREHPVKRTEAAHVLALATLAVAQPLFYVLGHNGEFFVASRTTPLALLTLVAAVVVGVPAILVLIEAAASVFGDRVRRSVHVALVALLCAIIALPMVGKLWSGPAWHVLAAALAIGVLAAIAYVRFRLARLMASFLAAAPLVVAGSFLFHSDATKVLFPGPAVAARSGVTIAARTPVMLVIFDELPLASLLDETLRIDAARYPNFAQLAATSHWFRNATSVSDATMRAVPSIFTGRRPKQGVLATASQQPDSLFTFLAGSYDVHAQEPVTSLCPPTVCRDTERQRARVATLVSDVAVVFGHALLPRDMARTALPPIDQGWTGFGSGDGTPASSAIKASTLKPEDWYHRGSEDKLSITPNHRALYALHYMVPHLPWRFLPDGHQYWAARDVPGLGAGERWMDNQTAIEQAHQRHLLQVGYVDRVLGNLVSKLKAAGIYDDALVIVVADHGCSFRAGDNRRHLSATNWSDVLRVPLLVKVPRQREGIVDDHPVQNVDIVPTIADVLGATLPFRVDGQSLLRQDRNSRAQRIAVSDTFSHFAVPDDLSGLRETVARNAERFGNGSDTRKLFGGPLFWPLVGRPVAGVTGARAGAFNVMLFEPELFTKVRGDSPIVPALVSGVISGPDIDDDMAAAVAINGIVRGVGPLTSSGPGALFQIVVPGTSFRPSGNSVEVLVADRAGDVINVTSARLGNASYALKSVEGHEALVTAPGDAMIVKRDAVRGFVDTSSDVDLNDYVSIWGWAVDRAHAGPPAVLVFGDGRLVATTGPTTDRPDVAKVLRDPAAMRSGFVVRIPQSNLVGVRTLRLFGVSANGTASELMYAVDFPYLTASTDYRLVSSGGREHLESADKRSIPVRQGTVKGYVDAWSLTTPANRLSITGWAAESSLDALPDVVVFADGIAVAARRPQQPRPDVAAFLKDDRGRLSGFRIHVPASILRGARRIRVFGVSRSGAASELSYPPDFPHQLPQPLGTR